MRFDLSMFMIMYVRVLSWCWVILVRWPPLYKGVSCRSYYEMCDKSAEKCMCAYVQLPMMCDVRFDLFMILFYLCACTYLRGNDRVFESFLIDLFLFHSSFSISNSVVFACFQIHSRHSCCTWKEVPATLSKHQANSHGQLLEWKEYRQTPLWYWKAHHWRMSLTIASHEYLMCICLCMCLCVCVTRVRY